MSRPQSNRSYKVKDKATGLWVTVEATPTPSMAVKTYYSRIKYKRKGYANQHKPQGTV
jgi:hypothetical protein